MKQGRRLAAAVLAACLTAAVPALAAQADTAGSAVNAAQAKSVLLMERETGTVLYEENADQPLEPASVTKIMTLLLVTEALDSGRITLGDLVTVSEYAASMGGSQVYLEAGEQMTVDDLLKAVAVASGNDAAVALAEYLAGSEGAFVEEMNQRAEQLGMENTQFLNCTGLPEEGHVTSARDIALMSRELMGHDLIRGYTTIWMDTLRDGEFQLANTNKLLRSYSGATGLKTGFTDSALYCISATAQRDGMELIAVVMGAPTAEARSDIASALLDYGFANYALVQVKPGQALPPVPVLLGQTATVQPVLEGECVLLVEKSKQNLITTQVTLAQDVEAPVETGQKLGEMAVLVDGVTQATVPIVAAQPVERLTWAGIFGDLVRQLFLAS